MCNYKVSLIAITLLSISACSSDDSQDMTSQSSVEAVTQTIEDQSMNNVEYECGNSDHPKVSQMAILTTHSHNVSGEAHIIDNCTIEVRNFSYDGLGPTVYFYGGIDGDYEDSSAGFAISDIINGTVYENSTYTITLSSPEQLDEMNGISVWCSDFSVSFGDGLFL